MTFNKKLRLIKLERQNGSGGYTETAEQTVWANVYDVGITTKYTAAAANRAAELTAVCHRAEVEAGNYTHAEYNGHRYRIESTGAADTERHIKLILAKGG